MRIISLRHSYTLKTGQPRKRITAGELACDNVRNPLSKTSVDELSSTWCHMGSRKNDGSDRPAIKAAITRGSCLGLSEVARSLRHYLGAQSQGQHTVIHRSFGGDGNCKKKRSVICLETKRNYRADRQLVCYVSFIVSLEKLFLRLYICGFFFNCMSSSLKSEILLMST